MNHHDVALFDEQHVQGPDHTDPTETTQWVKRSPKAATPRPAPSRREVVAPGRRSSGQVVVQAGRPSRRETGAVAPSRAVAAAPVPAPVRGAPPRVPSSAPPLRPVERDVRPLDDLDASLEPALRRDEPVLPRRGSHAAELLRRPPPPARPPRVDAPRRSSVPGAAVTLLGAAAAGLTLTVIGSSLVAGGVVALALLSIDPAPPTPEAAAAAVAANPAVRQQAAVAPRRADPVVELQGPTLLAAPRAPTAAAPTKTAPSAAVSKASPGAAPAPAKAAPAPARRTVPPPAPPPASAVVAEAAPSDDWLTGTVSSVASRVASFVAGEPQGLEPVAPATAPATTRFEAPLVGAADATAALLADLEADRHPSDDALGTAASPALEVGRPAAPVRAASAPAAATKSSEPAPATGGGWMDAVASVTAEVASIVTGSAPAVAPGTPDPVAARTARPAASALSAPSAAPAARPVTTAAPPPAAATGPSVAMSASPAGGTSEASGGWMDTVVATAASVAAVVTGADAGLSPVAPATAPAVRGTDLALDDDLGVGSLGTPRRDAWQAPAAADDPALLLLAEIDAPSGTASAPARETGGRPSAAALSAPSVAPPPRATTAAAPRPATGGPSVSMSSAPATGTSDASGGWMDTVLSTAASVAAVVTGADAGLSPVAPATAPAAVRGTGFGTTPSEGGLALDDDLGVGSLGTPTRDAWQAPAPADDPALLLLAELDAPSGTASASARETGGRPAAAAVSAPSVAPPPRATTAAAPSRATGGPSVTMSSAPATGTSDASGGWMDTVLSTAATVASLVTGESAVVAPATVAPGTSGPAVARVDLLADDDGLDGIAAAPRATDGWQSAAASDDPAMLLLAEIDGPSAARVAPPPKGGAAAAVLAADLDDLPVGPVAAVARPADPSLPTADRIVSPEAQRREVVNAVAAPGPLASAGPSVALGTSDAAPADGWSATASSWLDSMTTTVASWMGSTPAAAPSLAAATPLQQTTRVAPGAAPAAARTTRVSSSEGTAGVDLLADDDGGLGAISVAVERPVDAWQTESGTDDPALLLLAELDGRAPPEGTRRPTTRVASSSGLAAAAAAAAADGKVPVCTDGELCDTDVQGWRDGQGRADLLTAEDAATLGGVREVPVAELFYVAGADDALTDDEDLSALDTLRTIVVRVSSDTPGVPLEIDGRVVGDVPTVVELTPGRHMVRVGAGNATALEAWNDPDQWCFEGGGRSQKAVRCL